MGAKTAEVSGVAVEVYSEGGDSSWGFFYEYFIDKLSGKDPRQWRNKNNISIDLIKVRIAANYWLVEVLVRQLDSCFLAPSLRRARLQQPVSC